MRFNFYTLLILFFVVPFLGKASFSGGPWADTLDSQESPTVLLPDKIVAININGNHVTKSFLIQMYIGIDTGMVYDSAKIAQGKHRLLNTNLFSKVDIVPLRKTDGIHVYIIVTEFFYLYPEGGGDLFFQKYGNDQMWWRLRLGLTLQNFRGMLESFSTRVSIWEDKSIAMSWSKPLVPSPYYFGIGAGVHDFPEFNYSRRRTIVNGRILVGRNIFNNSKIAVSLLPTFTQIDSMLVVDTAKSDNDKVYIIDNSNKKNLKELYTTVGWYTDHKNRSFDPTSGWSLSVDALTNAIYAGSYNRYFQVNSDFRFYHCGFFKSDRFAYRSQLTLRANDAGSYRGLYIGGEGTIRGFGRDQFGMTAIMNDYAIITAEYRFPLFTTPAFDALLSPLCEMQLLSDYSTLMREFYLRFDGALVADAGHIFNSITSPITGPRENAGGAGFGIRAMMPTLRRSICFDVVWGVPGTSNPLPASYFWKEPAFHLYIDMYY